LLCLPADSQQLGFLVTAHIYTPPPPPFPIRLVAAQWYNAGSTGWIIGGSSPGMGWEFFATLLRPERLWGLPSLLSNGYQGLCPWSGREAHQPPPSSGEVKE
jgi:hypothetical protein